MQKGKVSVNTENIFPIIKKFLYTDHEIFLRELISNAVDATNKLKVLSSRGEAKGDLGDLTIKVKLDEEKKTITISDKGIGMTADEIDKYINQIAFSGAEEFVEKYKDKEEDASANIIGHFGLGFYSSFMVADKVEIHTLSHVEGSEAALWECQGTTDFKIKKGKRKSRGTDIILHINEDSAEFLEKFRLTTLLNKYCKFLPVEIEFDGNVINNTQPAWKKSPSDLTDEDYLNFYKELYPTAEEPLFWIHLNVDYPFNLTGILYFPKLKKDIDPNKNKIQLYSNQVFVTDNVEEIVPEYLMLLHGVIDSPDIPLNVSRSSLQADAQVKKITGHISKKVSDKLAELFKDDRADFESKWNHISVFVKYGMISDDKFYDRSENYGLLKNADDKHFLIKDYFEAIKTEQTDKNDTVIALYASDKSKQHSFIDTAKNKGYDVLVFDDIIDHHFIQRLEGKLEKTQFKRVDAETIDKLIDKDQVQESKLNDEQKEALTTALKTVISDEEHYELEMVALDDRDQFISIHRPEWQRRMFEMQKFGGMAMFGDMKEKFNVSINANNPLALELLQAEGDAQTNTIKEAFDLALLGQNLLEGEDLTAFIKRSMDKLSV